MDAINNIYIQLFAIIGFVRVVLFFLVGAVNFSIKKSESLEDDKKWEKIKNSWWFILIQFLLDYGGGTKVKLESENKKE